MTGPLWLPSLDDGGTLTAAAEAGTELCGVRLRQPVPSAHKIALRAIPAGAVIRKYGQPIGIANATLAKSMADDIDVDCSAVLEGMPRRTGRDDFQNVAYGRVGPARQVRKPGRRRLRIRTPAARRPALITGKETI